MMLDDEYGEYENYLKEIAFYAAQEEGMLQVEADHFHTAGGNNGSVGGGYHNYEQDFIREAYSSAAYTSIRDLPNHLKPGEITLNRQMKMIEQQRVNILPEEVMKARRAAARNNGLFHQFEYVPSKYTLQKELEAQERMQSKAKALELGGGRDFTCPSAARRAKYEDGFGDKEYRFPYLSSHRIEESERLRGLSIEEEGAERRALAEQSRLAFKPFIPPGRSAKFSLDTVTRDRLDEIMSCIGKTIREDWDEFKVDIDVTKDDHLSVRFDLVGLDNQLVGLRAYMNVFENTNKDIIRYGLKRSLREWNKQPGDGYIYFLFQLPWKRAILV